MTNVLREDSMEERHTATPIDAASFNQAPKPLTIAFFSSSPGGTLSISKWLMWRGIAEAAQNEGVNLIYVAGDEFETSPQAVLYDLIGEHNVDGVIIWNSFVSQNSSLKQAQEFADRFHPLPVVSVEMALEGCTNLLVNNTQGVCELLAHLTDVHGYRKIGFVCQPHNYNSSVRQAAFEAAMREAGYYDPNLVGSLEELDARGVRFGQDCQVILAPSDEMAVQVIETLRQRGLRVPEDVVVTGFNDGLEARGTQPALTTVRLPFRALGLKALEMVTCRIRCTNGHCIKGDESCRRDVYLNPYMILRRSCGCVEPMAEQSVAGPREYQGGDLREALVTLHSSLTEGMIYRMGTSDDNQARRWSVELVEIFTSELERHLADPSLRVPSTAYLHNLSNLAASAVAEGCNVSRWHEAITLLRQALLPYLRGDTLAFAEDLWQQARVLVGQVAVRAEVHRSWETARRAEILRETEAQLLIAFEFNEVLDILTQGLAKLGLLDFYLVLYEQGFDKFGRGRVALAVRNGERLPADPEQTSFPVRNLLPECYMPPGPHYELVLEALHLREEQIGYLVFVTPPPDDPTRCDVFQALRVQLSSALKGVRLRQKLHDAHQQAEEANQLKSRFLSMVSHELRTPLNLIVGLSEMAMRQQAKGQDAYEVLQKFMEQIYVSGQHLDRLIRDVLDLASSQAGQMSLICKPLDLRPVLEDLACMGGQLAQQKNLAFRMEVPDELPKVNGDKTRLRQILLNLISNAVKFTAHGEVAVIVEVEEHDILISVKDTGLGIAKEEQEKIFDEFHQSDRSLSRGYGGIGLGLAITRRLVELHGGRIWVTSDGAEGSGSTFHFTLPVLAVDTEQQSGDGAAEVVNSREGVVLILTGDLEGSQQLAGHLTSHGFMVEKLLYDDPPRILQNLMAAPPGAVVLDFAPASEQGWDVMKRIKENPGTHDIPVLFYSLLQNGNTGAVLEMDYLTKPVGSAELVMALRRHGLLQDHANNNGSNHKDAKKILVVDDEPGILDLHVRIVQKEMPSCVVLTAQNGNEALEMMRKHRPDLVLLDLMMPELDGFGVLKAMQMEDMLRNTPVIVLSAQVLTSRDMALLNQGVAAVLSKGLFSSQEILCRIETVLARSRRLGGEVQRLVQSAMAYIHEHFNEPISRADIANYLNINEQYLSRCFNKEMGIGPMVYLSRYRIQRAKRLLEIGSLSITQVAMEVGMSSQSYFSRVFQEETGVTPSAYQRGVRPPEN